MSAYKEDYKRYDFGGDTPLKGYVSQIKEYLDKKFSGIDGMDANIIENIVKNSVEEATTNLNENLEHVERHINHSIHETKHDIIDEIHCHTTAMCNCNLVTKEDIKNAVEEINNFTQSKLEELNFEDLNQMVQDIKTKLE